MKTATEWQPARLRKCHEFDDEIRPEELNSMLQKVVRIRPTTLTPTELRNMRNGGCTSDTFYEIHGEDRSSNSGSICCADEILTD